MTQIPNGELFFTKLKEKLESLGFPPKVAMTVASHIHPVKVEGSTVIADCRNSFYRNTIINAKMREISEIAKECWGPGTEFFLRSDEESTQTPTRKRSPRATEKKVSAVGKDSIFDFGMKTTPGASPEVTDLGQSTPAEMKVRQPGKQVEGKRIPTRPVPFSTGEMASQKEPASPQASAESAPIGRTTLRSGSAKVAQSAPPLVPLAEDSEGKNLLSSDSTPRTLMPELTFSTFVRGQSNLVAYSACEAIARNPGNLTNPVFIYGATGLGKTHLLHSVGNEIQRSHRDWHIVYVTSGDFMNELIAAIRFNKQEVFRNKYRQADVLLVDDIQFLENKDTTQLEFFHTFNELYQKRKQVVITSDKYPKDIPNIEERLKSRFLQGLIADIEPPSFEDRVAIIEAKCKILGLKMNREVTFHLATHVKSNVREIQGVLNNLMMAQSMSGQIPTIESTSALLRRIIRVQGPVLDIHSIQKTVAAHFGIKLSELMSQNRSQKLVIPRHIAMYLAKELVDCATTEIAEAFGKKDHTTVMHALAKVRELLEKDASTRAAITELRRRLDQSIS